MRRQLRMRREIDEGCLVRTLVLPSMFDEGSSAHHGATRTMVRPVVLPPSRRPAAAVLCSYRALSPLQVL